MNQAASVDASNASTVGGSYASITINVSSLTATLACDNSSIPCPPAAMEGGVFQVVGCSPTAAAGVPCATVTGTGNCAGSTFNIAPTANPTTGTYTFTPTGTVPLTIGQRCTIPFLVNVLALPANNAGTTTVGIQTDQIIQAFGNVSGGANDGFPVSAAGTNSEVVLFCAPASVCAGGINNSCASDICNAAGTACVQGFTPAGTNTTGCPASSNACQIQACNGAGACTASNVTNGSNPAGCAVSTNACQLQSCQNGVCTDTNVANGTNPPGCAVSTNACMVQSCQSGTCTPSNVANGSNPPGCAASTNACQVQSCQNGACTDTNVANGTNPPGCAISTNACQLQSCQTGVCSQTNVAAGSNPPGCAASTNACQTQACNGSGVCADTNVANGTNPPGCAASTNACQLQSCQNGACTDTNVANGTNPPGCAVSTNTCVLQSCQSGTCTDSNAPNTTQCAAAANTCTPASFCSAGTCVTPPPNICQAAACLTPGFWGTHAGTQDNSKSVNWTQTMINLAGGSINICGQTLTNTTANEPTSAEVALCSNGGTTQLARQLTNAALNCIATLDVSGQGGDCAGVPIYDSFFAACNTACVSGTQAQQSNCLNLLSCVTNGQFVTTNSSGNLFCATGTCSDNGAYCTSSDLGLCSNPATATCNSQQFCADALPASFGTPGPAGSPKECNSVKNSCTIFSTTCP